MKFTFKISAWWWVLLALVGAAGFYWILLLTGRLDQASVRITAGEESASSTAPTKTYKYFSQLNGEGVESKREIQPLVVGAMIDNHPEVWSVHSGLTEAKVVYEALVEAGTTRYLALFTAEQSADKVGPIRSARPYFVNWLREYGDALYLHSGGSPEALDYIKKINLFDANEFWWGKYYWRSERVAAPHNLFTNASRWQELLQTSERTTTTSWPGWKFTTTTEPRSDGDAAIGATIPFSGEYSVRWEYQPESSVYARFLNGRPHIGSEGNQLLAATVVIQFVPTKVIDEEGRRELATVGGGEARIFLGGRMIRGQWKKTSPTARTKFFNPLGEEIPLAPGKIWVEVVPTATKLQISS